MKLIKTKKKFSYRQDKANFFFLCMNVESSATSLSFTCS